MESSSEKKLKNDGPSEFPLAPKMFLVVELLLINFAEGWNTSDWTRFLYETSVLIGILNENR